MSANLAIDNNQIYAKTTVKNNIIIQIIQLQKELTRAFGNYEKKIENS